mmetsp:Transcript_50087/g.115588  ORF Transcript_50087/g.115588 Transcript_50087/m.115588 type:complete len:179 (-) Transcript_50087:727-1263(-)
MHRPAQSVGRCVPRCMMHRIYTASASASPAASHWSTGGQLHSTNSQSEDSVSSKGAASISTRVHTEARGRSRQGLAADVGACCAHEEKAELTALEALPEAQRLPRALCARGGFDPEAARRLPAEAAVRLLSADGAGRRRRAAGLWSDAHSLCRGSFFHPPRRSSSCCPAMQKARSAKP